LRSKVEKKLNNLIATNSISQEEFNTAQAAYNEFILHLTIFFDYNKLESARLEALKQARIFIPVYNKKVVIQTQTTTPTTPVIKIPEVTPLIENNTRTNTPVTNQRVYGDVYYFDYELRLGNYNDDVTHLQKILLREGYFDYATTGYY
jgi:hypothetical protein